MNIGSFCNPKSFFDSPAERILEGYLDQICYRYNLGVNLGIRIITHQPVSNYIQKTNIKPVDTRNAFMHFDFLFEIRKIKGCTDERAGHFPLLAIELNGKTHDQEEQIERDEYKRGICSKLRIPLMVIRYQEEHFTQKDIEELYLEDILTDIFISIFMLYSSGRYFQAILDAVKRNILAKYPENEFPEIHKCLNEAHRIVVNDRVIDDFLRKSKSL